MSEFKEFFDYNKEFAVKTFGELGEVRPMLVFLSSLTEAVGIVPILHMDAEYKTAVAAHLRKLFEKDRVDCYVLIHEMWYAMVDVPRDSNLQNVIEGVTQPSKDPNRREGVIVYGEARDGQRRAGFFEITRSADGAGTLGEFQEEARITAGYFGDLFQRVQ